MFVYHVLRVKGWRKESRNERTCHESLAKMAQLNRISSEGDTQLDIQVRNKRTYAKYTLKVI